MTSDAYLLTYLSTTIFCGILAVSMAIKMNSKVGSFEDILVFRCLSGTAAVNVLANSAWAVASFNPTAIPRTLLWIINSAELISLGFVIFFWYCYVLLGIWHESGERDQQRIGYALSAIPLVILIMVDGSSPLTHATFYLDEANNYVRGNQFWLHYIPCMLYFPMAIISYLQVLLSPDVKLSKTSRRRIAGYILLGVFPLATGAAQVIIPGAPLTVMGVTTSVFILFITVQDKRITTDALTGLNNRVSLEAALEDRIAHAQRKGFSLYIADANNFKKINDTWSHVVGDHALKEISQALRTIGRNHRSMFICRWGGDEFVFIVDDSEGMGFDDVERELRAALEEVHNEDEPFTITMSLGVCHVTDPETTTSKVILAADESLYKSKLALKRAS